MLTHMEAQPNKTHLQSLLPVPDTLSISLAPHTQNPKLADTLTVLLAEPRISRELDLDSMVTNS